MARSSALPARRPAASRSPASPPRRAAPSRTPLTHARVVAAALELIEQNGLAAFSVRGIAAALGCEPMSIYHYFPSKAHLQDAIIDQVLGEFKTRPAEDDPIERLRTMMYSFRALAHRYPKLFQLLATHRLNTPTGVRVIEDVLELVRDAMPDEKLAGQWFRVLSYYVTGAALDETAGYAKGPSAAEPVSDAYVAEHCPNLYAVAPYFKAPWWDSTFALGIEQLLGAMRAAAPPATAREEAALSVPKPVIRPKR